MPVKKNKIYKYKGFYIAKDKSGDWILGLDTYDEMKAAFFFSSPKTARFEIDNWWWCQENVKKAEKVEKPAEPEHRRVDLGGEEEEE